MTNKSPTLKDRIYDLIYAITRIDDKQVSYHEGHVQIHDLFDLYCHKKDDKQVTYPINTDSYIIWSMLSQERWQTSHLYPVLLQGIQ